MMKRMLGRAGAATDGAEKRKHSALNRTALKMEIRFTIDSPKYCRAEPFLFGLHPKFI